MTVLNEESLWWSRTADRQRSALQTFSAVAVSANCTRHWNEKVKPLASHGRVVPAGLKSLMKQAHVHIHCALTRTVSYISGKTCDLVHALLPVHFMRLHLAKRKKHFCPQNDFYLSHSARWISSVSLWISTHPSLLKAAFWHFVSFSSQNMSTSVLPAKAHEICLMMCSYFPSKLRKRS